MNNSDFSIYLAPKHYLVLWEESIYVFPMAEVMEPDDDYAAMLAYTFTGDPETKPKELTDQLAKFTPMPDEDGDIRNSLDKGEPWIHMSHEQIQEINKKAKGILSGKTLH